MKKNTFANIWRYAIICLLAGIILLLVMCTPTENCTMEEFIWALVWTKGASAALLFGFCTLYKHWDRGGHLEAFKSLFADDLKEKHDGE